MPVWPGGRQRRMGEAEQSSDSQHRHPMRLSGSRSVPRGFAAVPRPPLSLIEWRCFDYLPQGGVLLQLPPRSGPPGRHAGHRPAGARARARNGQDRL